MAAIEEDLIYEVVTESRLTCGVTIDAVEGELLRVVPGVVEDGNGRSVFTDRDICINGWAP